MATISINNLARAIYESSYGKESGQLADINQNAISLISKKHMMSKSNEILSELEKIIDRKEEMVRAKVSTKTKIDKKIINEIEDFIKKRYKAKNVILELIVEESLLGGIKIEVGDEVIDMTLKNKIHRLKNYLINS